MIVLSPGGLALFLLWTITASANPQLRPVFRAAEAYNGLSSDQRKCAVDDTYAAVYKSPFKDKECFCASPQYMSDTVNECLVFYSDFLVPKPEVYSAENYNGIMMFFGNECGTFQVQTKVGWQIRASGRDETRRAVTDRNATNSQRRPNPSRTPRCSFRPRHNLLALRARRPVPQILDQAPQVCLVQPTFALEVC